MTTSTRNFPHMTGWVCRCGMRCCTSRSGGWLPDEVRCQKLRDGTTTARSFRGFVDSLLGWAWHVGACGWPSDWLRLGCEYSG
jgi:hypothetical protein